MPRRWKKKKRIKPQGTIEFRHIQHTRERAEQRIGIKLTVYDQNTICKMIHGGQAIIVNRPTRKRSLWKVEFGGKEMLVIYDSKRDQIVTVFNPETYNPSQENTSINTQPN